MVEKGETSKRAVQVLYTDDFGVPPRSLNIEITTDSGKIVNIVIPYDNSQTIVMIDGEKI